MPKPRPPIKGSKQTTDPAAIAWRNLPPDRKAETFGREFFLSLFNAGLIDKDARPTGIRRRHRRTTTTPKPQQIEPTQ